MFRQQNLKTSLTHIRAFPAASQMPRHTKAWKFNRPLSQNKEYFRTENLYKLRCLGAEIPHESRHTHDSIICLFWWRQGI